MNRHWVTSFYLGLCMQLAGCSTMHIPTMGFEDSVPVRPRQAKLSLGAGSNQSLDFNTYAQTNDPSSIDTTSVVSPILAGAIGLTDDLEISLSSYAPIPVPSMVGAKYQVIGASDDPRPLSGSLSMSYGFTSFGDKKKYTQSGNSCNSTDACSADANSKYVYGQASAYGLAFPIGYRLSRTFRLVFDPQITYFSGWYTRHNRASPDDESDTEFQLSGLRKTLAFSGFYRFTRALSGAVSCQIHNYAWNGIEDEQSLSLFVGITYLGGDLLIDEDSPAVITRPPLEL